MFDAIVDLLQVPDPGVLGSAELCAVALEGARRVENVAACRKVMAAAGLWEHRMCDAHEMGEDAVRAGHDCVSEIGVRLGCSRSAARALVEVAGLVERMPALGSAFAAGEIDYASVKAVCGVFGDDASAGTLALVDEAVARAAGRFGLVALRNQVWRLWLQAAPEEAGRARARRASADRCAYVRRMAEGVSWVSACVSDVEGEQVSVLLAEITDTVCARDPRSRGALRADGFMALLHGEAALVCRCGQDSCPKRGIVASRRRGPLINVVVDAGTLLGLADNPGTLADGTPIDPELARILAEDATWQAIVTEIRETMKRTSESDTVRATDEPPAPTVNEPIGPEAGGADSGDAIDVLPVDEQSAATDEFAAADDEVVAPVEGRMGCPGTDGHRVSDSQHPAGVGAVRYGRYITPQLPPIPLERCLLGRGRNHRPGRVRAGCSRPKPVPTSTADVIDAWTDAIDHGRVPLEQYDLTGHGGYSDPPAGALVYRPRADVAALVRAQHPTCAFPQCAVPSRRCELDHVVPFDHQDPVRGGWTIPVNLQPLCKVHHDAKSHRYWTCTSLPGGVRHWRHHSGIYRITAPCNDFAVASCKQIGQASTVADPPSCADPLTVREALDLLYEETWWERNMTCGDHPGNDPDLIPRYREYQAIAARRSALQPAPF